MLHLRRALLRHVTTSSRLPTQIPFPSPKPTHSLHFLNAFSNRPAQQPDPAQLAQSLSAELLRDPTSLPYRLYSAFPNLSPSPTLIQSTLSLSAAADRRAVLGLLTFLATHHHETLPSADETLSLFVDHFGKLRDFKSTRDVILAGRKFAGPATAASNFAHMVRSGRIPEAAAFLDNMEKEFGIEFDGAAVKAAAEKLCENAFEAERTVRRLASEARSPRHAGTWNVVMSCLCKIRRPDMASMMLDRMCGDSRVKPNETSYITVIRGLYKAGRIEEGDAVMERMKGEAGLKVDGRVYYRVLKTLCNVGKFEHAVSMVKKMKEEGVEPGVKVYLLMMDKLGGDYRVDKKVKDSKPGQLKLRPRLHKLHEPGKRREKPVKVTETISEKVKRKRRRIKQVRLMFVKKPIRGLHRPF